MLVPTLLANDLEAGWLSGDDGPYADSTPDSADAFATIVSNWFANAQAAAFPVTTAQARKGQLMALTVPALSAQNAVPAGQLLAVALMAYMAGQSFGAGVSAPPIATAAAGAQFAAAFADLAMPVPAKATQIALAVHLMALTSIVTFPVPPFAAPVT